MLPASMPRREEQFERPRGPDDPSHPCPVNLYDLYVANGMTPGFWVKRRTWGDLCARITFVGELDPHATCYGHPPVRADLFSFSSRELKQAGAEIMFAGAHKTWRQIPPPPLNVWRNVRKSTPVLAARKVAGGR